MTTMDREPEYSLDYVIGRLDGVLDALQEVKNGLQDLSRRIDQTNERIDKLILALVGIGGALVVTVIGGIVGLGWAILQAG